MLAAIGAGIPIQEARGHMVVDIGGGTADVAVISLGGIVASTSVKCAGDRLDHAIADYIKKTYNLGIGEKTAEDIKIGIGSAVPVDEELSMKVRGRDFISGLPRSVEIKTNDVVKAMGKELREIIKAIRDVLQETPPELAADIIDHGITMTGGTSQLRNFPELVLRRTGVKARSRRRSALLRGDAAPASRSTISRRTKRPSSRSDKANACITRIYMKGRFVDSLMRYAERARTFCRTKEIRPGLRVGIEKFGIDDARRCASSPRSKCTAAARCFLSARHHDKRGAAGAVKII